MFQLRKRTGDPAVRRFRTGAAAMAAATGAALAVTAMAGTAGALTIPSNVTVGTFTYSGANHVIIGAGSATTYNMMQALDTLFNQTPGCDITSTSVTGGPTKHYQQLNYSCEKTKTTGGVLEQVAGSYSYLDNPINDVSVQEPPMGSSNGIAALEYGRNQSVTGVGSYLGTATKCTKVVTVTVSGTKTPTPEPSTAKNCAAKQDITPINYARSSRTISKSKDVTGLNFVAYAQDGVAPFYFSEWNSAKTPQEKIAATLSGTQLYKIWHGTIYDWGQLGSKTSAPIYVYSAQEGSGTQATFKTYLEAQTAAGTGSTFDPSSATNAVNCKDPVKTGTAVSTKTKLKKTGKETPAYIPTFTYTTAGVLHARTITHTEATTCKGPTVIFENEDGSILRNAASGTETAKATAWQAEQLTTGTSPVEFGIFFYSYGKFSEQCAGVKEQVTYITKGKDKITYKAGADCGGTKQPTGSKVSLSNVNKIVLDPADVVGHTWPIDRYLNNVYSNGHNTNIPVATAATLNYVSEVGFLCKTQTVTGGVGTAPASTRTPDTTSKAITDPATGLWYHDEIFNTILSNGFIPLDVNAGTTYTTIKDGAPASEDVHAAQHAFTMLTGTATAKATYLMGGTNHSITATSTPTGYCLVHSTTTNGNTHS